jgi:hypothetical protein
MTGRSFISHWLRNLNMHRQQGRLEAQAPMRQEFSISSSSSNLALSGQHENTASVVNEPAPDTPVLDEQEVDQHDPPGYSTGLKRECGERWADLQP